MDFYSKLVITIGTLLIVFAIAGIIFLQLHIGVPLIWYVPEIIGLPLGIGMIIMGIVWR